MQRRRSFAARMCILAGSFLLLASIVLVLFNLQEGKKAEEKSSAIAGALTAAMPEPYASLLPAYHSAPFDSSTAENSYETFVNTKSSSEALTNPSDPFSSTGTRNLVGGTFAYDLNAPDMPRLSIGDTAYLGILYLPSVNLELPVAADWSYAQLSTSPCRFYGSYLSDDLVLCGHNYASHFWALLDFPLGERVIFTAVNGATFHYVVANREILAPDEVSRLLTKISPGDWSLTLVTCTPGGSSRLAVRCVRIKS